jgi:nitronate monooxygenase
MMDTAFTRRFDLTAPVALAPMAGVSGGALAAAVTHAGGLGLIGGGYGDRAWLERELAAAGNAAVGVGFITWSLAKQAALLDLALERKPRAIFLSFGDLAPFAPKVARAGVPLIAQVQSVVDARAAVDQGAAVVVAQGSEAGGHGAARATLPLVPAAVDALPGTPVLAAGGIADGRGLAAALALGAAGAVCGTAFVAAEESLASAAVKQAVVAGSGDATTRGRAFDIVRGLDWPTPFTIRTLENDFTRRWGPALEELARFRDVQAAAYRVAQAAGDTRTAAVIVGEAVDLVREIAPAAEIVGRMTRIAEGTIRQLRDVVR